jgi:lipopolysaccharide transport system permease protein
LWEYRDLFYLLTLRDVSVRYQQTAIGAGWAILQPLLMMLMFTLVFGRLAGVPSEGLPYPVFACAALLPWNYFAQAISRCGSSLVSNANLVGKVYFPRVIVPLSAAAAPLVDLAVSLGLLLALVSWYGITPSWGLLSLPLFLALAVLTAVSAGIWLAALNVRYRDVGHAIPFLIQFWMFATPVAYPFGLVPRPWRPFFLSNPMTGVVEGFRWALVGGKGLDLAAVASSLAVSLALLASGILYFRRVEDTLVDII